MHRTEIFICFQNQLMVDALQCFISSNDNFLITGRCHIDRPTDNKIHEAALARADIIIVESDNASSNFTTRLQRIKSLNPNSPILLLSEIGSKHDIRALMHIGIRAFLVKSCTSKELLLQVLDRLKNNQSYYCSSVTEKLLEQYTDVPSEKPDDILTDREIEILSYLAREMNTYDIAGHLYLSPSTVKTHRRNIMRKLDASSLLTLLRRSMELGLLTREELILCKGCAKPDETESCVSCS